MLQTETGGYILPEQTLYARKIAKGPKEHFTGHIVVGDPGNEYIMDVESHTEMNVALVLLARREVVTLENQVPFTWQKENGATRTHFFDFRAHLVDGKRVAVMVKGSRRTLSRKKRSEISEISQSVTRDFADMVVLMASEHLDPVELFNASLIHEERRGDPKIDAAARRAIVNLRGSVRISELQRAIGEGGAGFGAIVRLLACGDLELSEHCKIEHDARVRRRNA